MQEQVGVDGLLQRGLEGLDQLVRQVADEADGVGQGHRAAQGFEVERAGGGVERGKQLVGGIGLGFDQGIEQRALAGIGIAHQRDPEGAAVAALVALGAALALDLGQPRLERFDALVDHAAVKLDLRLARATALAGTAGLALQVAPAPHQARAQVLQPGQLDLQLAFMALRTLGKDLQDQRGAVGHGHPQVALKIALLGRRQGLVEDHAFGAMHLHQGLDLVGLAAAHKQRRVGCLAARDDPLHRHITRALGQQRQLIERGVEEGAPAEIHTHQHHARRARLGQRRAIPIIGRQGGGGGCSVAGRGLQAGSAGSAAWKLTGRPGTTVEMACL